MVQLFALDQVNMASVVTFCVVANDVTRSRRSSERNTPAPAAMADGTLTRRDTGL